MRILTEKKSRIEKLEEKFPNLKKTLKEIEEMDLNSSSVSQSDSGVMQSTLFFSQIQKNGLEGRWENVRNGIEKQETDSTSEIKDRPSKRRRLSLSQSRIKRKMQETQRSSNPTAVVQPKRRMVAVDFEQMRQRLSQPLVTFYDASVQAIHQTHPNLVQVCLVVSKLVQSGGQVRLLMKKVLSSSNIESSTVPFVILSD